MKRRNILIGLGGLAGVGGVAGTGAFSSVSAERTVSVAVADDDQAFLKLEPSNTVYGDKFAKQNGDGLLELNFGPNGRGDGLGTDSIYEFDDVFTVTNQGTQPVYVWATFERFGNGGIWLYPGSDDGTKLRDGDDSVVELAVGDTVHMGVHVDTTGVDLGTTEVQGTIHANATKPDESESDTPEDDDPYAPTAPDDYVAYYPLDGDADDVAGDNSGDDENTGVTYGSGKVGQAATFDDSGDQHVELADGSAFGYDTFSVAAWAKVDADADQGLRTIIARQTESGTYTERTCVLWFDVGNGYFGAETLASRLSEDGDTQTITTDENYTDGDWHHVAMTVDGGNEMKLYVDGIEQGSQALGGNPFTGDAPTWLGQEPGRDDRPLDGSVDEVQIFDRVLSATEVDAIYSAAD